MNTNEWPSIQKMYKDRKKLRKNDRRGLSSEITELEVSKSSPVIIKLKKQSWLKRLFKKIFLISDKTPKKRN